MHFIAILPLGPFNAAINVETQGVYCCLIGGHAINAVLFNVAFDVLNAPCDEFGDFALKTYFKN